MLTYPIIFDGRTFLPGGEIPAQNITVANCGHVIVPEDMCPGWYADADGYTWCEDCAHEVETAEFARSAAYTAYLTRSEIATGAGTVLARVTETRKHQMHTPSGGWYLRYDIRAVAGDGSRWHGRSYSSTCLITLRRYKTEAR